MKNLLDAYPNVYPESFDDFVEFSAHYVAKANTLFRTFSSAVLDGRIIGRASLEFYRHEDLSPEYITQPDEIQERLQKSKSIIGYLAIMPIYERLPYFRATQSLNEGVLVCTEFTPKPTYHGDIMTVNNLAAAQYLSTSFEMCCGHQPSIGVAYQDGESYDYGHDHDGDASVLTKELRGVSPVQIRGPHDHYLLDTHRSIYAVIHQQVLDTLAPMRVAEHL